MSPSSSIMRRFWPGVAIPWGCVALLLAAAAMTGCQLFAVAAVAFPPKIKPIYELQDRPTLVMVEDPNERLGDPALIGVIADQIDYQFAGNKVIKQIISPTKLHDLMESAGDSFASMPLDRIGRELGAKQVVNVVVESASLHASQGYFQPEMVVRVKVIDVDKGRLFPPAEAIDDTADVSKLGYPVHDNLRYQMMSESGRSDGGAAMHRLSERIGDATAQLFFEHPPPAPGNRFQE